MTSPVEICQKSHWDYVLEEMTWLANDFVQVLFHSSPLCNFVHVWLENFVVIFCHYSQCNFVHVWLENFVVILYL